MLASINDTTTHVKKIQKLMIDVYVCLNGLSATILKDIFTKIMLKYNLLSCGITLLSNPKSKIYRLIPQLIKFRVRYQRGMKICHRQICSNWHCSDCSCNIVDGVGFIN